MSARRLVTIMCDEPWCHEWVDQGIGDTAAIARAQLRGSGWVLAVPAQRPGPTEDYCPKHAVPSPPVSGLTDTEEKHND